MKITEPTGGPEAGELIETVALKVMASPGIEGLMEEARSVVVSALFTRKLRAVVFLWALETMIEKLPAPERSLAEIVAVSCEELRTVVGREFELKKRTAAASKLAPLTVRVSPGSPAVALSGETALIAGNDRP